MKKSLFWSLLPLWIVLACTLASAQADTFIYDDAGRLLSATQTTGLNHSYSYDEESNLLSVTHTGTSGTGGGVPDWWGNYYFGAGGVNPLGNPAHDGMSNLMKYALGLNPNLSDASAPFSVSFQGYTDGNTYPYLTYIRSKDAAITLGIQMLHSTNLTSWQAQGQSFQQVGTATDLGDGTEQLTLRCLTPVKGSPKLFFRLQITTP